MQTSSRSSNDIMSQLLPLKSGAIYEKEWRNFNDFCNGAQPLEDEYIQNFDHLHNIKKLKGSTMWAEYSRLNNIRDTSGLSCNNGLELRCS